MSWMWWRIEGERERTMRWMFLLRLSVALLFVASCAVVTTYGVDPKQVAFKEDAYMFTYFYNVDTTPYEVEQHARKDFVKFMKENSYKNYEITRTSYTDMGGKCVFEVQFSQ